MIARIADGALRDGLSILDQCSSRSKNIDSDLVSRVAGLAGRESLYQLTDCIGLKNSSQALEIIASLYQNSYDMERLCVELINHFRNFLIVKTVKKSRELIVCTDDEYNSILESAKSFTLENIIFGLDLLQITLTRIKAGANSRIEMEMAFIKLCEPKLEQSVDAMLERIAQLERAVKNGVSTGKITDKQEPKTVSIPLIQESKPLGSSVAEMLKTEESKADSSVDNSPESATPVQPQKQESGEMPMAVQENPLPTQEESYNPVNGDFDQWQEFLDIIHKTDIALFGVLSNASAHLQNEHFVIDSPNPTIKEFIKIPTHLKAIKKAVFDLTGKAYKIGVCRPKSQSTQKRDLLEDLIHQAQNNIEIKFE